MSKYDERSLGEGKYPYSFQQKIVLRYIKYLYPNKERATALLTYCTICWIASDFSNEESENEVNNWPKVVATYSGLGIGTTRKYIRQLSKHGLIKYFQTRNLHGQWNKRKIVLPSELPKHVLDWLATNGNTDNGITTNSEVVTL